MRDLALLGGFSIIRELGIVLLVCLGPHLGPSILPITNRLKKMGESILDIEVTREEIHTVDKESAKHKKFLMKTSRKFGTL